MSSGGGPPETAAAAAARPWLAHAPAPLHLDLLGDPEEEPGLDERDYDSVDTPRDLLVAHAAQGLPSSPRASQRKTKSRAAHALARHGSFTSRNSLKDNKVGRPGVGGWPPHAPGVCSASGAPSRRAASPAGRPPPCRPQCGPIMPLPAGRAPC